MTTALGKVYRCPVCGAELTVLAPHTGDFQPHCCHVPMVLTGRRVRFYVCPHCGAQVAVIRPGTGEFTPVCCGERMKPLRQPAPV